MRSKNCFHATISGSKNLIAQRVESEKDQDVNLAVFGAFQKPIRLNFIKKVKYVLIDFTSQEDCLNFKDAFTAAKRIFTFKMREWYQNLRNTTMGRIKAEDKLNQRDFDIRRTKANYKLDLEDFEMPQSKPDNLSKETSVKSSQENVCWFCSFA